MKIGIILSTNGSAFFATHEVIQTVYGHDIEFVVIHDRQNDFVETECRKRGLKFLYLLEKDNKAFSDRVIEQQKEEQCYFYLFFFTRLITEPLISELPCYNIHPSLLPSFKGLHALKNMLNAKVKYFGATLHRIDQYMDTGKIVAQIHTPSLKSMNIKDIERYSYFHKVYLSSLLISSIKDGYFDFSEDGILHEKHSASANPCIINKAIIALLIKMKNDLELDILI